MIRAPRVSRSSEESALTVAWVPTGMKTGVSTGPWGVSSRPRRAAPADDLITHLIAAEEAGARLTTEELISTCILLLNAGHEATVHTIGNGVKALLETGNRVTHDNAATCVEEILRHDPSLHMFTRWAYDDVEVMGHQFHRGDQVAL